MLFALLLVSPLVCAKDYVSFFGRALDQTYLPNTEQVCPEANICMDVVYRWTIQIDKVASGQIKGRTVKAARFQHTKYIFAHQHQALYVLSRIEDEKKRKLLGADYWLEEYAPPSVLYCISSKNDYGIEDNEVIGLYSGTQGCYGKQKDP